MDFRQLRTFSCVAELGSLSKASDTLRVAQPALSRQIKLLEHELRTELFTRNGRGMVLTEAGRLLLARTAGIVRQIDQIRDDIQSAGGTAVGPGRARAGADRELRDLGAAGAAHRRDSIRASRSASSRATAAT